MAKGANNVNNMNRVIAICDITGITLPSVCLETAKKVFPQLFWQSSIMPGENAKLGVCRLFSYVNMKIADKEGPEEMPYIN